MIKSGRSTGARNEIALILSEEWKVKIKEIII